MHEMSLISNVIDIVINKCEQMNASGVHSVQIVVGEARDVVDELAVGLYEHLAKGTIAEGSKLEIIRTPLTVRCNKCGYVFPMDTYDKGTWGCPSCGAYHDFRLTTGMEFMVRSIEIVGA